MNLRRIGTFLLLVMISSWGDCLIHEAEPSLVATQLDAHASGDQLGLSVDTNAPPPPHFFSQIQENAFNHSANRRTYLDSLFTTLKAFYLSTNGDDWTYRGCPAISQWNISQAPQSIVELQRWCGLTFSNGRLTRVILSNNNLTGSLPPELGDLKDLTHLLLDENQLTGIIPPELGKLKNLTFLSFYRNQLSGPIPIELTTLDQMGALFLGTNQLTGHVPPELGKLKQLGALGLSNNPLTGTFPVELTTLDQLYLFSLSSTEMTGVIPPEIGNLTNLGHV